MRLCASRMEVSVWEERIDARVTWFWCCIIAAQVVRARVAGGSRVLGLRGSRPGRFVCVCGVGAGDA